MSELAELVRRARLAAVECDTHLDNYTSNIIRALCDEIEQRSDVAWLIERRPATGNTVYLGFRGSDVDNEQGCGGTYEWTTDVFYAMRFSRRMDAVRFIGALRTASLLLPLGQTLRGLRDCDPAPAAIDHVFIKRAPAGPSTEVEK